MSADNGIYIIKFPEGFCVAEAQCIENIDFFPEGTQEKRDELKNYFGESKFYNTIEEANVRAKEIYNSIMEDPNGFGILEYGICYLGEYESFLEEKNLINPIFKENYSHEGCDCYKIKLPYTKYSEHKHVLCKVSEGYEKARNLAIAILIKNIIEVTEKE